MPEQKKVKITVIKPAEIRTIESKITVREIEKSQLKIIQGSKAWQEHQKTHKGAQLHVLGAREESRDLGRMENAIIAAAKELAPSEPVQSRRRENKPAGDEQEQSMAPGQQVTTANVTYKSNTQDQPSGGTYHGGHGAGTIMASCNCGQTFKSDESGETHPYKINTEAKLESPGGYGKPKEHEAQGFQSYGRKSLHEEVKESKTYGRR